ncbi:MAG: hypothetical protein KIS81_10605 [Maricaulaceae bacterium]|nr:hypothetical protein [Maricaulaceae bacterium]
MKKLIATAALLAVAAAPAAAQQQGQVIRLGDSAMTCQQIIGEAAEASDILGGSPEGGVFGSEQAVNTATALGQHAALHAGAGRAIPGIGAVGGMLGRAARARQEQEEARRQVAERRWYFLNGLYEGRRCDDVLAQEAAAQTYQPAGGYDYGEGDE